MEHDSRRAQRAAREQIEKFVLCRRSRRFRIVRLRNFRARQVVDGDDVAFTARVERACTRLAPMKPAAPVTIICIKRNATEARSEST